METAETKIYKLNNELYTNFISEVGIHSSKMSETESQQLKEENEGYASTKEAKFKPKLSTS